MRPLRSVVKDIARAMRRTGRRTIEHGRQAENPYERVAGQALLSYAEQLQKTEERSERYRKSKKTIRA